ncbi:MAG: outer membrane protein transport protein [Pseudolabrys sp.]|nr:outer membrane protein transport protein [Pseudolabrys sp.]
MLRGRIKSILLGCTSLGVLLVTAAAANAGGFALREQSAYGQGSSFAGIAAGGALSSMFWNPATITQFNGKTVEQVITGIMPYSSNSITTATGSSSTFGTPGNQGMDALVPAGYSSWQVNEKLWVGMSVNAPFGLGVHFPQVNAASSGASGNSAKVETYNFAPTVAYKINDMISVAVGLQAQYLKASYDIYLGAAPSIGSLNGAGWGFGWTAGVTLTPLPKTTIGIGYRSAIDQKVNGNLVTNTTPFSTPGSVNLTLPLPDMVTVGLRQGIGDRFTLLAGIEWSGWSRIGRVPVWQGNGAAATVGGAALAFPFNYRDGWYYSLGGEYKLDSAWTVRAGIAFERTPISDDVRTIRIPDNDRMWYSVGASYKPAAIKGMTFDLGYSFIDVKTASLCLGAAVGCASNPWSSGLGAAYLGSVKSTINIISISARYQWDADPVVVKQAYAK